MLDIGELCRVFAVFAAESFYVNNLHSFFLHGFLEIFLGGHMLFIIVGIENGSGLIA